MSELPWAPLGPRDGGAKIKGKSTRQTPKGNPSELGPLFGGRHPLEGLIWVKQFPQSDVGPCSVRSQILCDANTPIWMNADGIMDPYHLNTVSKQLKQYYIDPPIARQKLDFISAGSHH